MGEHFLFYENKHLQLEVGKSYVIGRDKRCDIVIADRHVSRRHACLAFKPDCFVLSDLQSANGTWVDGKKIQETILAENAAFRIADCNLSLRIIAENVTHENLAGGDTMLFEHKAAGIIERLADPVLAEEVNVLRSLYNRKKEKLAELAFHDKLTKLFNRGYFDTKLLEEITRSIRYRHPLALMMIDIDHFKEFNDRHGHQKGDEVLAVVAGILGGSLRNEDIVCRYGGEEMVVILPETSAQAACIAAETCRSAIERHSRLQTGLQVTVSIGVAELGGEILIPEQLIKQADLALYRAKQSGRNRVLGPRG